MARALLRISWAPLFVLGLACGCQRPHPEATYLSSAVDSLYRYSLYQARLDRDDLRRTALAPLTDTSSRAHSHAILHALALRLDRHSGLLVPTQVRAEMRPESDLAMAYPFSFRMLEERIALVRVDGFGKGDSLSCGLYADSLQRAVLQLHAQAPIGWLIDLRQNTGGNLYPMLAGLGPLLACGDLGREVDARGGREAWWYCRDKDHPEGASHITLVRSPVVLQRELPAIVLIGRHTASAGEALAMSFIGRPATRFFGERTAGYTTGNHMCFLADSAILNITTSVMMDRAGNTHPEGIAPDLPFGTEEEAFMAAVDSLLRRAKAR